MQRSGEPICFGDRNEWTSFFSRHEKFFDKFDNFNATMRRVFIREFVCDSTDKEIVHWLGRLTIEDFMEIMVLCANGYGFGALRLLRGQYERTVTAGFIAKHPETAERFVKYGSVAYRRLLNRALQLYGEESLRATLSPGKIEEIEEAYQEVKDEFVEMSCSKCGKTRQAGSWYPLDLASMAQKAGYDMDKLYHSAYMIPTQQAHATVLSLLTRIREDQNGAKYFDSSSQHDEADSAFATSHATMLVMMQVQNDFFKLRLDSELEQRNAEYCEIWKSEPGAERPNSSRGER